MSREAVERDEVLKEGSEGSGKASSHKQEA